MTYSITSDIPDNLLELYLSEQEIAIDSEFHGLRLYRDEVCLIQICDDKKNVSLVKPYTKKVIFRSCHNMLVINYMFDNHTNRTYKI